MNLLQHASFCLLAMTSYVPAKAHTVIVGAGIAGCSVAYHLNKRRVKDIVVLDQGPLFATGGSTSHAPGGILTMDTRTPLITQFGRDSAALYETLGAFSRTGSIDVARTQAEVKRLEEKMEKCVAHGHVGPKLLKPAEVARVHPLVDPNEVKLALHFPPDMQPSSPGRASAVEACKRMAYESTRTGNATFHERCKVIDVVRSDRTGEVEGVTVQRAMGGKVEETHIECQRVVCAAGAWGPLVAELAGVSLPIMNVEHQWALTRPLPALSRHAWPGRVDGHHHQSAPAALPSLVDSFGGYYVHQFGDRLGVGNYGHAAIVTEAKELASQPVHVPSAERPFDPSHFIRAKACLLELMPGLAEEPEELFERSFHGLMSYPPDGFPLLGPVDGVGGLWVAECWYVWHAGGAGRMLADWMEDGSPERYLTQHTTTPAPSSAPSTAAEAGNLESGVTLADQALVDVNRYTGKGVDSMSPQEAIEKVGVVYESRMTDHAAAQIREMNR